MRHVANKLKMTLAALVCACMLLSGVPAVAFASAGEAATDAVGSLGDAIESLAADDDAAQQPQTLATDYSVTTIVYEATGSSWYDRAPRLYFSNIKSNLTVDWGDGRTTTVSTDRDSLELERDDFPYASSGPYTITISSDGSYCLGYGTSSDKSLVNSPYYPANCSACVTSVTVASNASPQAYSFYGFSSMTSCDLSHCDTSQVTDMSYMCSGCSSLTSISASNLDTSQVTDMSRMFSGCYSLTSLNFSAKDTSQLEDMSYMFSSCYELVSLTFDGFDTSHVTDMNRMFDHCTSLETFDLSLLDTSSVTNMSVMFYDCTSLTALDFSSCDTSHVTDMNQMFRGCTKLGELNLSGFNTSHVENMSSMFRACTALTEIDVSSFNTSGVTDMSYMFSRCSALTTLDLSGFDTSNVTTMSNMFSGYSPDDTHSDLMLKTLDISGFDTSSVIDMSGMFDGCAELEEVDVSVFDTTQVTNMECMFYGCSSLTTIDVSGFDTSKVTNMGSMFEYCSSLVSIDASGCDTTQVTDMSYMFYGCSLLSALDLSSFDNTQCRYLSGVFNYCTSLRKLVLGSGFSFYGTQTSRKFSLPSSLSLSYETTNCWVEITTGQAYSYNGVPNGAGTYYAQAADTDTQTLPLSMDKDEFQVSAVYNGYRVIPLIETDYLDVTEYTYTCSDVQADANGTNTATVTISGAGNYADDTGSNTFDYPVTCEKVEPTYDASPTPTAVYGDTLDTVTLPTSELGTWAWSDKTESVGDAGRSYHEATFTPSAGTEIDGVTGSVTVLLGIKVSPRPISDAATVAVAADTAYTYTGSAIEPAVTVTPQTGYGLAAGTDYTLRYYNNTNVGTATATIIGCGNYTGRASATFAITPIAISKDLFSIDLSVEPYTGSAVTKEITSDILRKSDYTVVYADNVQIGTATITITGKNNCTDGTLTYTFQIAGGKIDTTLFTVDTDPVTYAGQEITKEVSSTAGLIEGTDYTVTYDNNVDVGTAYIYIEGTGIYSGSLRYTFRITSRSVTEDDFSVDESAKTYTGLPITAKIDAAEPLVEDRDYTVTYTDNTEVGTATLVIRCDGKNCTGGPFTYSFDITSLRITTGLFSVDTSTVAYTGKEITKRIVAPEGLEEGRDYIISYANNREIGSATINIIGINNCYGTAIYTFKIVDPRTLKSGGSKLRAQTIKLAKKKVKVKHGKKAKVKVKGAKTKLVAKPKNKKAKKALKIKVKGKKKLIVKAKATAKRGTYKVKVYAKKAGSYSKSNVVKLKVKVK